MSKAYKVTISGTYHTSGDDYIDYEKVEGYIPFVDEEFAEAMIIRRYAKMWLTLNPKYKTRVKNVREVYIDAMEPAEHDFIYEGKVIQELGYEELQDLAVAKDLRAIPLYKTGGIRESRVKACVEYSLKVLGRELEDNAGLTHKKKGFTFSDINPMIISQGIERHIPHTFTNEEIIQHEMDSTSTKGAKATFTRPELEKFATKMGIIFNPAIGDVKLYDRIFS